MTFLVSTIYRIKNTIINNDTSNKHHHISHYKLNNNSFYKSVKNETSLFSNFLAMRKNFF